MCFVEGEDSKLIVVVFRDGKLCAFSAISCELLWQAKQEMPHPLHPLKAGGVTTDGRGHLFVSDLGNKWVQKFSLEGDYLGRVVCINKIGQPGFAYPISHIRYMNKYSSLVLVGKLLDMRYYVYFFEWKLHQKQNTFS